MTARAERSALARNIHGGFLLPRRLSTQMNQGLRRKSVARTFSEEGILGIQSGQEMVEGALGHSPKERRRE